MTKDISKIVTAAVIVEGTITYFNHFFISGEFSWQMISGLILGITTATVYEFDLPKCLGMKPKIPYFGCILTGILISRGSNYLYDFIRSLK